MPDNPLSSRPKPAAPKEHPVMQHARIWQAVGNMSPDTMEQHIASADYTTPFIGALAANPKVTRKDVIKSAADWAGAGKITPSKAVEFISQAPDDPDKLQPWLKGLYAANLTALVHMKAAMQPAPAAAPASAPGAPLAAAQPETAPAAPVGAA